MQESETGHLHPMTQMVRDTATIFSEMGFSLASGPEIESEYYNFDALNIPEHHPARDMQDTFWLKEGDAHGATERHLLRTHTSPVQVRYMQQHEPPLRVIVPGRVYRNEATDATHEAQFYQVEGFMVGEDVTLADLRGVLAHFLGRFFGADVGIRFRPGFFPFVEPGVEVDASCFKCKGGGCGICKHSGWIELMGAGMIHPNVLEAGGIHPRRYRGFAFGAGLDRFGMLKYGIDDVRLFYTGDLRFVNQF